MTAINNHQTQSELISAFKLFYKDMKQADFINLADIYAEDIVFCDPIHELRQLPDVIAYLESSVEKLEQCKFEYLDEVIADGVAFIKWNMHFLHPSISPKVQTLRGVTHLLINEKITYHEDIYDVGAMVYEHLPLMGSAARLIKRRMAKF